MSVKPWHGRKWPQGVSYVIKDYARPLFSILDDSAWNYPDKIYTIFEGSIRTYRQVKNSADRIAQFWPHGAIGLETGLPYFSQICLTIRKSSSEF